MELPTRLRCTELYKPLRSWQTRILRLHPGAFEESLSCDLLIADLIISDGIAVHDGDEVSHVQYEALSYVWGSRTSDKAVCINGQEVEIMHNLYEALLHSRGSAKSRYLWADALCTNQNDNGEKAIQVRNMMTIYQKAIQVNAWLCADQEYILWCFRVFGLCERHNLESSSRTKPKSSDDRDGDSEIQCIRIFFQNEYFSRVWVQQESYAAKKLFFCCEEYSIDSQVLYKPLQRLRHVELSYKPPGIFKFLSTTGTYQSHLGCGLTTSRVPLEILETFRIAKNLEASDPLDKVYAILGMTGIPTVGCNSKHYSFGRSIADDRRLILDDIRFPIDYELSPEMVDQRLTEYFILRDRNLSILLVANTMSVHNPEVSQPSWVLNLSYSMDNSLLVSNIFRLHNEKCQEYGTVNPNPEKFELIAQLGSHEETDMPMMETEAEILQGELRLKGAQIGRIDTAPDVVVGSTINFEGFLTETFSFLEDKSRRRNTLEKKELSDDEKKWYHTPIQVKLRRFDETIMTQPIEFLVPHAVATGDTIVLFHGGLLPFVLRPKFREGKEVFSLMGHAIPDRGRWKWFNGLRRLRHINLEDELFALV